MLQGSDFVPLEMVSRGDDPSAAFPRNGSLSPLGGASALTFMLMRALDEVDYGLMLLGSKHALWYANHLARVELTQGQLLHLSDQRLRTHDASRQGQVDVAIERAAKGIRSMVHLRPRSTNELGTAVAFVPLGHPGESFPDTLPVLGITCRPVLCASISLHFFAQTYGLTRAEESVLAALVEGLEVEDIAEQRQIAASTVRGHVKQLRIKTQTNSMRELLNRVAVLPPVVSSVRST